MAEEVGIMPARDDYLFAALRPAQYFFIRALTAFRCAAVIVERVRLRGAAGSSARPRRIHPYSQQG